MKLQDIEYEMKEGIRMLNKKKSNNKLLNVMASAVKKSAEWNAQFPCGWWNFQPKKPQAVKKMRKF